MFRIHWCSLSLAISTTKATLLVVVLLQNSGAVSVPAPRPSVCGVQCGSGSCFCVIDSSLRLAVSMRALKFVDLAGVKCCVLLLTLEFSTVIIAVMLASLLNGYLLS